MKNCLLCANSGKHCVCEHCENYDNFIISNEGKLTINQIKKEITKEICDELKTEVISVDSPCGGEPAEEDCEAVLWWKIEKILRKKAQVD